MNPGLSNLSPPTSPLMKHSSHRTLNSPNKLTPIEKKERDRKRAKEQSRRRVEAVHNHNQLSQKLLASQQQTPQWHQQERQAEELILRRLERDVIDPQKVNPAAAGYRFYPSNDAWDSSKCSPVFAGYSPAICPREGRLVTPINNMNLQKPTVRPSCHPIYMGYVITKRNDSSCISPVFFLGYEKIPLDEINAQDDHQDSNSESDEEMNLSSEQYLAQQTIKAGSHVPNILQLTVMELKSLRSLLMSRLETTYSSECLVCKGQALLGCPGCFQFSHAQYRNLQMPQRLKTPKTHVQEQEEYENRYQALRYKLMGYRQPGCPSVVDFELHSQQTRIEQEAEYYSTVLTNSQAVCKHRTIMKSYVTLHIKTLPIGNLLTLRIDLRDTVSSLYELYRANSEMLSHQQVHLLLPTSNGLFYLQEAIEQATDTRNGLVYGEFCIEDFHLQSSPPLSLVNSTLSSEYLLFSVSILHPDTTPLVVRTFLLQNFALDKALVETFGLETALSRLPPARSMDAYHHHLIPHVYRIKEFKRTQTMIERQEAEKERMKALWIAYQERMQAKQAIQRTRGICSRKVTRACLYFDYVCDSTRTVSHHCTDLERLEKLWGCLQLWEGWKLCKGGRLIEAENCFESRSLIERFIETSRLTFDRILERKEGAGPLLYPMVWIGEKVVVKIGLRWGCETSENYEYGLVLDYTGEEECRSDDRWYGMDLEWKVKSHITTSSTRPIASHAMLSTGSDLIRPPFHTLPWHRLLQAYQNLLVSIPFHLTLLQSYNALARTVQQTDLILSKSQLHKWKHDVESYRQSLEILSPLVQSSALYRATVRILEKKGWIRLKQHYHQRQQHLRQLELEAEQLRTLQAMHQLPPPQSRIEQMKHTFLKETAPKMNAAMEKTAMELVQQKTGQFLEKITSNANKVTQAAKKEYQVRIL